MAFTDIVLLKLAFNNVVVVVVVVNLHCASEKLYYKHFSAWENLRPITTQTWGVGCGATGLINGR